MRYVGIIAPLGGQTLLECHSISSYVKVIGLINNSKHSWGLHYMCACLCKQHSDPEMSTSQSTEEDATEQT